jgi:hypothetical protein
MEQIMSNKKHSDTLITDETTLMRRAWIDLALDSVRSQVSFQTTEAPDNLAAGYESAEGEGSSEGDLGSRRPHLYLAYSAAKSRNRFGS